MSEQAICIEHNDYDFKCDCKTIITDVSNDENE